MIVFHVQPDNAVEVFDETILDSILAERVYLGRIYTDGTIALTHRISIDDFVYIAETAKKVIA